MYMDHDIEKAKEVTEAFGLLLGKLGDDDVYKRILLEVLFEEIMKRNRGGKSDGCK
jgi:hypothetical protein